MKEYPRKLRVGTQLQMELAVLIRDCLSDPRVKGVTVTGVEVASDLRNANVSVSLLGDDQQLKDAIKGLNGASGKLRHELGSRLKLRSVPSLHFSPDLALREGDRISALIRTAVADDERHSDDH